MIQYVNNPFGGENMAEKTNLRDKLLDVGMAELNEFGYHNFSVRRIAAKCGVSCAAPYKHFKDKHSYVAAILEHINQQWTERQEAIIESYQGVWQRQIVEVCLEYIRFLVEVPYFRSAIMLKDESFDEEFQRPRGRLSDASRAQIAALADNHYLISKSVTNDRTTTSVTLLDFDERVIEIARTLGGANVTEITKENAKQLLLQKNDVRG